MLEIFHLILEQARNAWRFRWYALAVAWAVAVAGWLFSYSLPDQYQADARVHIDTQSAIQPLLNGMTVRPNVSQQVDLLIQTVLSRPNIEKIARQTGLDVRATTPDQTEELLAQLGGSIRLRNTGGRRLDLYNISFTASDPVLAQNVVQEVINVMTSMAVGESGEKRAQAMKFLSREVDEYKKRLDDNERELAAFKKDNAERMPGSQDYVSRLQSLLSQISGLRDELSTAQDRVTLITQNLNGTASGGTTTLSPERSPQVLGMDKRISDLRNQVGQMLTKYTSRHPDVLTAQRQIARLQADRENLIAQLRANPQQIQSSSDGGSSLLRSQLRDAQVQVSTLETSIGRKENQLENLKSGADDMTDLQAQLAELNRNYQANKDQYNQLLTRLYTARLSEDVQRSNNDLQFRVIDPPEAPSDPSGPNRVLLITAALLGGLVAGAAFAFFMSQMRPVYINRRALTDSTGLPVLGSISLAWTRAQSVRRRTTFVFFMAGIGVLFVCYVGALVLAPLGVTLVPSFITGQWL